MERDAGRQRDQSSRAPTRPAASVPGHPLLRLQATAGNAATVALLRSTAPTIQRDDLTPEQQDQYMDMGEMAPFTRRTSKPTSVEDGGIKEAIAVLPRNPDGSLTAQAITAIEAFERGEWDGNYARWMDERMPLPAQKEKSGFFSRAESDKDYRKRIAKAARAIQGGERNTVTGETKHPELNNVATPNEEVDANVAEAFTFSGVGVTVNYNKSDVNAAARIGMIAGAIAKITGVGGTIGGGLSFNLPKYGRKISMGGGTTIHEQEAGVRAVFVAPSSFHLSSDILNNPVEDTETITGTERLAFSSGQLDATGTATVVHELGHYSHYRNSPSQFHLLNGATWKNGTTELLAASVSMYGATHPREFVAEVFLGLVYGRTYGAEVLAMYRGLGGMPIGAAASVTPSTETLVV